MCQGFDSSQVHHFCMFHESELMRESDWRRLFAIPTSNPKVEIEPQDFVLANERELKIYSKNLQS